MDVPGMLDRSSGSRDAILDAGVHMTEDLDQPPRAYTTADVASQPEPTRKRFGWKGKLTLSIAIVLLVAVLGLSAYVWTSLHYTYSSGDRAGFIQKFSKKGWLCKTW